MNRQALADRIVTYSDTIVAFALVNGFAFLISLGEPDIRCSIARVSGVLFAMNVSSPIVSSYALVWLRRYEHRLRDEALGEKQARGSDSGDRTDATQPGSKPDPSHAPPIIADDLVSRFWRIAFVVRIVLIWLFGLIVVAGIYGATQDTRCMVSVG